MANDTVNININDTLLGTGVVVGTADRVAGWVFNIDVVNSYLYFGVMIITVIAGIIKLHDTWPNSRLKKFLSKKKKAKK